MRILILDDAPMLCAIFRRIAEALGHAVVGEAASLPEALPLVRALCPDAIVVDGRLGGAELTDTLGALREAMPGGSLFVVAALEETALVRVAQSHGAAGIVRRPFSRRQVREALEACDSADRGGPG